MVKGASRKSIRDFLVTHRVKQVTDSHTHIFERPLIGGKPLKLSSLPKKTITTAFSRFPLNRLKLVESKIYGDFGIRIRRVSFGLPGYFADARSQNQYVLRVSRTDKDTIPVALVKPEMTALELESLINSGFKGLKPYPEFVSNPRSIFDYVSREIIGVANKKRVPIVLHVNYDIKRLGSGDKAYLDSVLADITKLSKECNQTRIVLAHMAGQYNPELANYFFEHLASLKNVFLSTSFCVNSKVIASGINNLGANRVLFGTDPPYSLIKSNLLRLSRKKAKELGLHEGVSQIMVTNKDYAWSSEEKAKLRNSRQIRHVGVEQIKNLYLALSRLFSEGRIDSKGIRAILSGNSKRLFH